MFRGPIYAAYVPGTDLVVIGSESLALPPRPRGSGDSEQRWKSWSAVCSAVRKAGSAAVHWEWWTVGEAVKALPRPSKRLGAFMYGIRKAEIRYATLEGEPLVEYNAQPEVIRKFWRSTVAKLFRFTAGEQPVYPMPPSNFFNHLLELARSCRSTGSLPIRPENLTAINQYTNYTFAQLSHRYGFLNLSTNHILTFALTEKIASTRWSGSCADVVLEQADIREALCYWAERNLPAYTLELAATALLPERNLQLHHISQQLGVTQWNSVMKESRVLSESYEFLEREGSLDPNYIKVAHGTNFIIKNAFVPVLPLVPKNNRVCAFFYSIIQNDSFFAHFPLSAEPLPCTVSYAGATYALSALINLSVGRLKENLPINV